MTSVWDHWPCIMANTTPDEVQLWKIDVWDHPYMWSICDLCGSMLSCILCERQKFSESHKLKFIGSFGARNQKICESQWLLKQVQLVKNRGLGIGHQCPESSSEQRDLWPFRLLDLVWRQWNKWSRISLWVHAIQVPQKAKIWHCSPALMTNSHCPESVPSSAIGDRFVYWI